MLCIKCKKEIPDESSFCNFCGKKQFTTRPIKKAKKRANGTGSVYKLSGKRTRPWMAVITSYENNIRKNITIGYYTTEKEALTTLQNIDNQSIPSDFNSTLEEIYNIWSKTHYKELSSQSVEGYTAAWKHLSACHKKKIRDIKTDDFQHQIDRLVKANKSRSTCDKVRILANQLCKFALERDIVSKNYAQFLKVPKISKKEKEIFSPNEIQILWEHKQDIVAQIILTLIYSGMRIGEIFSIETKNIFLNEQYMIGGEKTEAGINRIIPIHDLILPFIEKWYNKENKYLLINTIGGKINVRNFREREYYPYLAEVGITLSPEDHRLTPHCTRHTFASRMVQANAKPELLQKIIGHENYETTVDVYTHFTKEDIKEMVAQVNAI